MVNVRIPGCQYEGIIDLIEIREDNLILSYSSGRIGTFDSVITEDVSFKIAQGKSLALIGETGSGKTMTALSIMGLLPAGVEMNGGTISFIGMGLPKGKKMRGLLGTEIVYIPQNGAESLDPSRTIRKQLYDNLKKLGKGKSELEGSAHSALKSAGFDDPSYVLDKYPFELSGGMCQRVTIALALCSNAKLIIADEPSNGLDDDFTEDLPELLKKLFVDAALLIITHDISLASKCDDIVIMCGGRVMERGPAKDVLADPKSPYTKALIDALPKNGMKHTRLLREGKSLCPFYSRCEKASQKCMDSFSWIGGYRGWRCSQ